ncbi:MAG: hypothetical protein J0L56_20195 [Chitinophagales bacterium]|nr:hypothetical protein [Chitinophagales bacterium]
MRNLLHIKRPHLITGYLLCFLFCWITAPVFAFNANKDSARNSTLEDAAEYLRTLPKLDSSYFWPNVKPGYLLENLRLYVQRPAYAFESRNTNFCGYTALSFVTLDHDPLGFVKLLVQLYKEGKAQMGRAVLEPSEAVRNMAGNLKYKGMLDINPATQMWFLALADHFKGYLNFFNKRYDRGDENRLWAATNFAKFNRMLRKLFDWKVQARGADLVRPSVDDLYTFLKEKSGKGTVFLYLNNRLLYKKKHVATRFGIPTHYVLLVDIQKENNVIHITYSDGGRKTSQQISPELLKKITYGITFCTERK